MREVTQIELRSSGRVRALAELAARMDDKAAYSRLGIVASEDIAFGLGRMFQTYRELVREFEGRGTKEMAVSSARWRRHWSSFISIIRWSHRSSSDERK